MNTSTPPTRIRRNRTEWQQLIREFELSGQSAAAFCRERGLAYASFQNWRRRLTAESQDTASPSFVEITPDRLAVGDPAWSVELSIGEHCVLRIR